MFRQAGRYWQGRYKVQTVTVVTILATHPPHYTDLFIYFTLVPTLSILLLVLKWCTGICCFNHKRKISKTKYQNGFNTSTWKYPDIFNGQKIYLYWYHLKLYTGHAELDVVYFISVPCNKFKRSNVMFWFWLHLEALKGARNKDLNKKSYW